MTPTEKPWLFVVIAIMVLFAVFFAYHVWSTRSNWTVRIRNPEDDPKPHTEMPPGFTLLIDQDGFYGWQLPYAHPNHKKIHTAFEFDQSRTVGFSRELAISEAWNHYDWENRAAENRTWRKAE